MPTNNYNLNTPAEGTTDWHVPLNENFETIDSLLHQLETDGSIDSGGVRHASDFSGANGGEMIQAAIDDMGTTIGHMIIGPEGPDSFTDGNGRNWSNVWKISSSVSIPSNTTLHIFGTIVGADGLDDNIFRNEVAGDGTSNRNHDIYYRGYGVGRIHQNPENFTLSHSGFSIEKFGIVTHKVDNCGIQNLNVGPTFKHATLFEDINQGGGNEEYSAFTQNITYFQNDATPNQDCHPLIGPIDNFSVDGLFGTAGDDVVFINGEPNGNHPQIGSGGKVEQVNIRNIHTVKHPNAPSLDIVKILHGGAGVENINISDCHLNYTGGDLVNLDTEVSGASNSITGVNISDCTIRGFGTIVFGRTPDTATVRDVHISNIHKANDRQAVKVRNADVRGLEMDNVSITVGNDGDFGMCLDVDGGTLRNASMRGCRADGRTNGQLDVKLLRVASGTLESFTMSDCKVDGRSSGDGGASPDAVDIQSGATVSDIRFRDNTFIQVQDPYTFGVSRAGDIFVNGKTKAALGGSSPDATLYQEGDVIEDVDTNGAAYLVLDSSASGNVTQIGTAQ